MEGERDMERRRGREGERETDGGMKAEQKRGKINCGFS